MDRGSAGLAGGEASGGGEEVLSDLDWRRATRRHPWVRRTPLSREEIIGRLIRLVPPIGAIGRVDDGGAEFPHLRYRLTRDGFTLRWAWRRLLLREGPADSNDSHLHVELRAVPEGTEVRFWLRSGVFSVRSTVAMVAAFFLGQALAGDLLPPGLRNLSMMGSAVVAILAAWLLRRPLPPDFHENASLLAVLDAALDVS